MSSFKVYFEDSGPESAEEVVAGDEFQAAEDFVERVFCDLSEDHYDGYLVAVCSGDQTTHLCVYVETTFRAAPASDPK